MRLPSKRLASRLAPALLALSLAATPSDANDTQPPIEGNPLAQIESAFVALFSEKSEAVARVKVATTERKADGSEKVSLTVLSGFFISEKGLVVTNALPRSNVTRMWIERKNQSYVAEAIGSDERSNVGLLRLVNPPPDLPYVELKAETLRAPVGSLAIGVTCPLDFSPSPAWGMVTGHESGFGDLSFPFTYTRVNIPVGPAEGGSPVFGIRGDLIGVSVATLPEVNSGYVVPTRALLKIVSDLQETGYVRHSDIHMEFELRTNGPDSARQVVIKSIEPGSQAANQKMQVGDTLVRIGELQITSVDQARDLLFFSPPGSFVQLTVKRGDKLLDFGLLLDVAKPEAVRQ